MPRYHCLIPDISGECILVVPAGEGRWALPAFEHDEEWFAWASTAVARGATERYGISMTALREHTVSDCHICELEIQAQEWTAPVGTQWIASSGLAATVMEPAALSAVLRAWFREREIGMVPAVRPPWEQRGWYAEAVRWVRSECSRLGYVLCEPVEQLKAAWSLSAILRADTSAGVLYFKADFAKPPSEPAIIEVLARRWPRNVPNMVAVDHDRSWMLMRDFGTRSLDGEPIARWQAATRTFAAIQVACSVDLEPWLRLGCSDLRLPVLVAHMDHLLGDTVALRIGEPGGLTGVEAARLREATPRLHDLWGELEGIATPASIVQQDFRQHNLALSGRSYVFYDWSETAVSHPFFACCRFLDHVRGDPRSRRGLSVEERRRRIADAYLEPWASMVGRADARRAFELARQLNPIYLAIRWYLDAPYCEATSSWGRAMRERPAGELRRWLADMDEAKPAD